MSFVHPRSKPLRFTHGSIFTLTRPYSFSFATVHSAAFCDIGDPVSRGAYTSVSQLARSITCERCRPSALILLMST